MQTTENIGGIEMTQNLSRAQWELIEFDINDILQTADNYKQLRQDLRDWLEEYGDYESEYRVDKN